METNSREAILAIARELYGRVVFTHKTHEKDRQIWSDKTRSMNRNNIILVSATTFLAVISVAVQPKLLLVLTATSAAITTAFVIWQASTDPVAKENQHRVTAKELLWIREQLLLLIGNCCVAANQTADLQVCLDSITRHLTTAYKFAPDTSSEAYQLAKTALKQNEEFTFSDEEIDRFLPEALRKNRPSKE